MVQSLLLTGASLPRELCTKRIQTRDRLTCRAQWGNEKKDMRQHVVSLTSSVLLSLAATQATSFALPNPSSAIETVSVTEATNRAKPLPQQEVDKGKVCVCGAKRMLF